MEKEGVASEKRRFSVNTLSTEYLHARRKYNFGMGEVIIWHPMEDEIISWKLKNVLKTSETGLLQTEKELSQAEIVDTDEKFLLMMTKLKDVKEVAVDVECTWNDSYMEEMGWLKFGTLTTDWLVDLCTLKECHKSALQIFFADPTRIIVMFGNHSDIIFLRRTCGIFLTGVFDVQTFWEKCNNINDRCGYRYVMESILTDRTITWTSPKEKTERANDVVRPPTSHQVRCMQEDVHILYVVWQRLKNNYDVKVLHDYGVQPVKERTGAEDIVRFQPLSFDADLDELRNHKCGRYVPTLYEEEYTLAMILWEYRKRLAITFDKSPEVICKMKGIVWMAFYKPQCFKDLFSTPGVKSNSIFWFKSDMWLDLICGGYERWKEVDASECCKCSDVGHDCNECNSAMGPNYIRRFVLKNVNYWKKHSIGTRYWELYLIYGQEPADPESPLSARWFDGEEPLTPTTVEEKVMLQLSKRDSCRYY